MDRAEIFCEDSWYIQLQFHRRDLQSELLCESSGVTKTAADKVFVSRLFRVFMILNLMFSLFVDFNIVLEVGYTSDGAYKFITSMIRRSLFGFHEFSGFHIFENPRYLGFRSDATVSAFCCLGTLI